MCEGYIGKRKNDNLGTGIPCEHPGCLSHVSHPCEGCGRILGVPAPMIWRGYVAKLERVARAAEESLVRLSPNSERVVLLGDGKELFEALADLPEDALGG